MQARGFNERSVPRLLSCIDGQYKVPSTIKDELHVSSLNALGKEIDQPNDLQFVGSLLQRLGLSVRARGMHGNAMTDQLTLF
jgi:hypothetical protein